MFGTNEIVGKKWFREREESKEGKLFVTSMFMTLQGEGPYRGYPAFFIRLAKCNLDCFFCDTFFDDGDWLSFDEINQRIENTIEDYYRGIGKDRPDWTRYSKDGGAILPREMVLVMTGGEPMLQENLGQFLEIQKEFFRYTQIESNGTQNTAIPSSTTLVISPKCMQKNGKSIKYLTPRPEVLERADCLKFVMEADPESPYSSVPNWAHEWVRSTGRQVFVSPMNVYNDLPQKAKEQRAKHNHITLEERSEVDEKIDFWETNLLNMADIERNHKYTANYCIANGFIFNMQMHLFAGLA